MSILENLKNELGTGARNNRFKVIMSTKSSIASEDSMINTLVREASIPGRSFADIEKWVQGRLVIIAGDTQYDGTWSLTFIDNESHTLRGKFNDWMEYIDSIVSNSRGAIDHNSYMTTAKIQQLSTINNNITAEYTFYNLYPKSLSDSKLTNEVGELVTFDVEFNFSHWQKTI